MEMYSKSVSNAFAQYCATVSVYVAYKEPDLSFLR